MAYQREEFINYLTSIGCSNTSPYCSCLDKIEKMLSADIDREYDADKCRELQQRLVELRGSAAEDAKKYGMVKNLMSKLNKYCHFRNGPEPMAAEAIEAKDKPCAAPLRQRARIEAEESFFFNTNGMTIPMKAYLQHCDTYEQFEAEYLEEFLSHEHRVGRYLEKLLWKYDKNQATVSAMAGLDRSYVGNIVRGRNNGPARDVLIAICLSIGTSVEEAQYLLRYAGHAPLYVRRKRDVIIWFGFMKRRSAIQVNLDLENHGFPTLLQKQ